ncbi:MAG: phenylalanine--tRNA ligase subunit beta [bacterium]|nr:phenylalanine--tRNA ligase subunit beta [bacterium]
MNLFVSYNWLKEFVQTREKPEELARLLSLSGPSVERSRNLGKFFDGMVVGKVVASEKHPNADRLTVNKVDVGGKTVQIICGAPNVRVGMLAAVALPGAKVRWHGEGDLVTLAATKIRGVESFGMMCGANEIGLEKMGGDGIVDISFTNAKAGTPLAKALDMDDTVFEIEVTSNRPDAMSVVGIAREAAVITKSKFLYKEQNLQLTTYNLQLFSVTVAEKKLCPRFSGIVVDGITVAPSPWWMQKRLLMSGLRPINNIVDITNYVMLEQGKPLHAFDAAKLAGDTIIVRRAKKAEKLTALDGKTYELSDSMLVIADKEKPVAIAGVMGGQASGVTEKTTRIVFESAVFDPVSIRKTARALNLHSEASNLFEKGLSPESTLPALTRAVELTLQIAGGHVASKLADVASKQPKPKPITLDSATVKRFLGIDLTQKEVVRILTALGFLVKVKKLPVTSYQLLVTPPWWRSDVTMDQDLVEEIGRIYGYHRLPSTLPTGELAMQSTEERKELFWERRVKEFLRGAGFTETMSYSFVSEQSLRKLGFDPAKAFRVVNPLSDDQSYLRPRPVASLFEIIATHQNERDAIRIFELAKMFRAGEGVLPDEPLRLAGVVMGDSAFREAKGIAEFLLERMGISSNAITFLPYGSDAHAPWVDAAKSVVIAVNGEKMGSVVTPTAKAMNDFGIKKSIALFRFRFQELLPYMSEVKHYTPLQKYPPVLRDLAFVFPKVTAYADVAATLQKNPLVVSVELFDLYEGAQVGEGKKSMALHVRYLSLDRTLTAEEVTRAESAIVKEVEQKFNAKLRDV